MTARQPDPVPGPVVARIAVPRRRRHRHRMERHEVGRVADPVAGVHHAPGQVHALVDEPELGPASRPPRRTRGRGIATAPSQTSVTSPLRVRSPARRRGTQSRGPTPPSRGSTRSCASPTSGSAANSRATRASASGCARAASSSRKNRRSPRTCGHAGVAPCRDADVLGQPHPAHAVGQPGRLPAVAHDHHVHVDALLASSESSASRSTSGRCPCVSTTHANEGLTAAAATSGSPPGGRAP